MAILTSDKTSTDQLARDVKQRLGLEDRGRAEQLADEAKRRLGLDDDATDRAIEAVQEARERLTERIEQLAAAIDTDRLSEELSARAGQARAYLEEHVDEETARVWGRGFLFALAGFLLGYLLGRRASKRRDAEDELWLDEGASTGSGAGLAQAPRTHGVGAPVR